MHVFPTRKGFIPSGVRLAFDFDSTICNVSEQYVKNIRKIWDERQTGQKIWPDMFNEEFKIKVPGLSNNQVWSLIIHPGLENTLACDELPGAIDFLRFWYGATAEPVIIVTSRPEKHMNSVTQWIQSKARVGAYIYRADGWADKARILEELGVTDYVEDRYRTCKDLAQRGFTVWMYQQPWNTNRTTPNCFLGNWNDIMAYYMAVYSRAIGNC